jgi:hypothetical protein
LLCGALTACVVVANDRAETKYAAKASRTGSSKAPTIPMAIWRLFISAG